MKSLNSKKGIWNLYILRLLSQKMAINFLLETMR